MAEPRASSPEIMGREFVDARFCSELPNDVVYDFCAHGFAPDTPRFAHSTEQPTGADRRRTPPFVNNSLHPVGHGHTAHVTRCPLQIKDGSVILTLLQVRTVQFHGFISSEAASD